MGTFKRYGFLWVTGGFFLLALLGHWTLAWYAHANEARAHGHEPSPKDYAIEAGRDTLENWQSEFLQLVWQVGGLSFLLSVGSTQSKEGQERLEEKIDWLLGSTPQGRAERDRIDARHARDNK